MQANLALLTDIIAHLLSNDEDWLHQHFIEWSRKGDYWILNYNQFGPANEYNILCRGLVINKHGAICSLPFTRFFNLGQQEAAPVQIENAHILEKLDGTFLGVFWPNKNEAVPIYHTRRMMSSHDADLNISIKSFASQQEAKFMREIGKLVAKLRFDYADRNFVFMFEIVTPMTRVVTEYEPDRHGLYLIGMRDMRDFRELDEDELDDYAGYIGVRRPQRWATATSENEIVQMMEEYANDFEGFVLRDKTTGLRVKIKKKSYLERHRLLGQLNYRNLLPLYFAGERGEIEAYFPGVKALFDKIEQAHNKLIKEVVKDVCFWQARKLTRKELALSITKTLPKDRCHFIFKFWETPSEKVEDGIKAHLVEYIQNKMVEPVARWLNLDADQPLAEAPKDL